MSENSGKKRTSLSNAQTLEEIADFWDTHSLDDYWDQTHDADLDLKVQRRRRIMLDPEVYALVEEQAHVRGVSPETLINISVSERLQKAG